MPEKAARKVAPDLFVAATGIQLHLAVNYAHMLKQGLMAGINK